MINTSEILQTVRMITEEKLDIRTITMGISLYECCHPDRQTLYQNVYDRITKQAEHLVRTGAELVERLVILLVTEQIVNGDTEVIRQLLQSSLARDGIFFPQRICGI